MTTSPTLSPGPGRVLLRCPNADGSVRCLGFLQRARRIEVWETLDEECAPPRRLASFVGELGPLRIARWLAEGKCGAGLWLDPSQAVKAIVEGLDDDGEWDTLVLNAWTRDLARSEPGLAAVLRVAPETLEAIEERFGALDANLVAELASTIVQGNREWVASWRAEIDAEVAHRLAAEGRSDDAPRRAAVREFVEECVVKMGRLPLPVETDAAWRGKDLPGELSLHRRRRLGLTWTGRVRRFRIRFNYWSAADTFGYSDLNAGPGWYFSVLNPDPAWILCSTEGPYRTSDAAWDDAQCVGQE